MPFIFSSFFSLPLFALLLLFGRAKKRFDMSAFFAVFSVGLVSNGIVNPYHSGVSSGKAEATTSCRESFFDAQISMPKVSSLGLKTG